ncbi:phosphate transport system permease protein PstA [Actinomycetes bacterium]|nr:phosphate transport system permease protein PstA [Actinomycetes bacterium]
MATIDYSSVKPQKPWRLDAKQLALNGMVFFLAILLTPVLLNLTPLNGKLGGAFIFVVLATAGNIVLSIIRQGVKTISTSIAASLIYLATALVLLPLTSVLYTVVMKGKDAVRLNTFTQDMRFSQPDAAFTDGGALHAILGTFEIVLIATIICVPLGVLTALYLTEIKGRFEGFVRFLVQAMSGVPSIVAGLFIYTVLIVTLGAKYSAFAGSLALSILMLPTVARTSEEVLKLIPNDLREAGVALGATQWRTVAMVVVPAARSGILTAVILGIARVAGETAPLLLTILGNTSTQLNPFSGPVAALPLYTFSLMKTGLDIAITRAWGGALILLTLVLILFITARLLSGKKR